VYYGQTDETWCRGRPRPWPHCVRWRPGSHPLPPQRKGAQPPIFGPCLLWPNGRPSWLLLSTCWYRLYTVRLSYTVVRKFGYLLEWGYFRLETCPKVWLSGFFLFFFRHETSSIVASVVNLVQPTTVASLSHWASTFVYNTTASRGSSMYLSEQCTCLAVCAKVPSFELRYWIQARLNQIKTCSVRNYWVLFMSKTCDLLNLIIFSVNKYLMTTWDTHHLLSALRETCRFFHYAELSTCVAAVTFCSVLKFPRTWKQNADVVLCSTTVAACVPRLNIPVNWALSHVIFPQSRNCEVPSAGRDGAISAVNPSRYTDSETDVISQQKFSKGRVGCAK